MANNLFTIIVFLLSSLNVCNYRKLNLSTDEVSVSVTNCNLSITKMKSSWNKICDESPWGKGTKCDDPPTKDKCLNLLNDLFVHNCVDITICEYQQCAKDFLFENETTLLCNIRPTSCEKIVKCLDN